MFERMFKLSEHNSNIRTEVLAGITTFLTMSYIIFVNPNILGTTGMDTGAVFVATCLAAAVGSFIMAFLANWPIGMAPGMGLNAFFAFGVVGAMGYTWQQALAAVFLSGVIFFILTLTGARKWLIDGIPQSLRSAIVAGIGLFLAFIGFQSSGIVIDNPATLTGHGDFGSHQVQLAILGFFIIVILDCLKIRGAILIGILAVSALSIILGFTPVPASIISTPPSISSTFLALDIPGVMEKGLISVLLVFVLVEVFDATGTMIGVAKRANLLDVGPNRKNNLGKALMADSAAILAGSLIGTSSTTAYVESMSGVQAGGRTGLTAFVIGILFLLVLFLSPLAGVIPAYATAPALIYVALLMLREITEIDWNDMTEVVPSAITLIAMPFTYSIAEGMAFGFISFVIIKAFTFRFKELHLATILIAALFVLRFAIA